MKYRSEIDGLRAVAVLPVVLFHAGVSAFSGGYVGVDVFFVISGYLITTILMKDIESNQFSVGSFYERRARRILPALFFVILSCIPFVLFLGTNEQAQEFGKSVIATSLFSSNLLYWSESGYFESNSLLKPLLHTWSLAVEEQFYIFFPPFLYLIYRYVQRFKLWLISLLACASIIVCEMVLQISPESAFYLLPTRAWELFAGTIAAFLLHRKRIYRNDILSLLGLACILYSIFAYDENTPFPGINALAPVLGTWLVIVFGGTNTIVARLLGARFFVGIGLISYSIYLWHQPLLAFYRLKYMQYDLPPQMQALAVLTVTLLAWFSWRFVELPYRKKIILSERRPLLVSAVVSSLAVSLVGYMFIVIPGAVVYTDDGIAISKDVSEKFSVSVLEEDAAFEHIGIKKSSKWNKATVLLPTDVEVRHKVLILGDSHAGHFKRGFSELLASEKACEVHIMTFTGCTPVFNHYKVYDINQKRAPAEQNACASQTEVWKQFVLKYGSEYDIVILSSRWNWLVNQKEYAGGEIRMDSILPIGVSIDQIEDRRKHLAAALKETIAIISSTGARAVLFSQPPVQLLDLRDYNSWEAYEKARPSRFDALTRQNEFDAAVNLSAITSVSNFIYAKTFDFFCPDSENYCFNREGEKSLYADDDHLSAYGAYRLGNWFLDSYPELFR